MLSPGLPPLAWGPCVEARAFFVRASTLPHNYYAGYNALIRQLIQANIWAKFDALYLFATYDTTNALLNLVSSSFTCTANGSPVFTQDRGYQGVDNSTTVYLDTGFNPSTATAPKFVQNAAHISVWSTTSAAAAAAGADMGLRDGAAGSINIFARFVDGNGYWRINDTAAGESGGIANTDGSGHYVAVRSGAAAQAGYKNGVSQGVVAVTSAAVPNGNMYVLVYNELGTGPTAGTNKQIAAASIGGVLTASETLLFYAAIRQFMQSRGVSVP